jgi:GT2 family glycosyltransferase/glycosyltransferase involved in cell wall biosynthesis
VHNAPEALERCLGALFRNTRFPAALLILDDASTDERVAELLEAIRDVDGVRILRSDVNQGFVATANRGFTEAKGDVVLLNSDTRVTPFWLRNLRLAAYRRPRIGTVTALSDNAGVFSVPEIGHANDLSVFGPDDAVGRAVTRASLRLTPITPTGNAFCMYVRREVLDEVGGFDATAFPRGYGEENDLSMRARAAGWESVVDDATLVFHDRGASFGTERETLMRKGEATLRDRWPSYPALVDDFLASAPMRVVRDNVAAGLEDVAARNGREPSRVLFVLHGLGGGTMATTLDLARALGPRWECSILTSTGDALALIEVRAGRADTVRSVPLEAPVRPTDELRSDYRSAVLGILLDIEPDVVHVRHLLGHTLDLPEIAQALGLPVVMSLHDFFLVCPTAHLIDDKGGFCGGVCTPGDGECPVPEPWGSTIPHLKHAWVYEWRDRIQKVLPSIAAFVTTSPELWERHVETFPELATAPVSIIAHGRDLTRLRQAVSPEPDAPTRILVPGNLTRHKGAKVVRELVDLDDGSLEFHFAGHVPDELATVGHNHGPYRREEFADLVASVRPSIIGIFSTTHESYSHVLTEAWATGVPVVASDRGALRERITASGGGWLVDPDDVAAAHRRILEIAGDSDEYRRVVAKVNAVEIRTNDEMAADYDALYQNLIGRSRTWQVSTPSG